MKSFLVKRLKEYQKYLSQELPILDSNGDKTIILNLDFKENSTEFLENYEKIEKSNAEEQDHDLKESNLLKSKANFQNSLSNDESKLIDAMKLRDQDLEEFLEVLSHNHTFKGELLIAEHNLTNEVYIILIQAHENIKNFMINEITAIRISSILKLGNPNLVGVSLNEIRGFSYIAGQHLGEAIVKNTTLRKLHLKNARLGTKGAKQIQNKIMQGDRVIEGIKLNRKIEDYDLGQLTNTSLKYLVKFILQDHIVQNISFSEDLSEPWKPDTKHAFLSALRVNSINKQFQSIDIYSERLEENQTFMAEIAILCQNNRRAQITLKNNEYKSKELNTSHSEYYDGDNHGKNAFQFSVKTYMSNVIETLLDEGLFYLEKERANITRDEKIFEINKEHINKHILDDIFKADGSLQVLARYMINKIEKKKESDE